MNMAISVLLILKICIRKGKQKKNYWEPLVKIGDHLKKMKDVILISI